MKIDLTSESLKKYLRIKLNKKEDEELTKEDVDLIEEISINRNDINGIKEDFDFKDFQRFENLKFLSLKNFRIRNYETNIMNRITTLIAVQMTNCKINSKSSLQGNLELISFENCKSFKLSYISKLKKIKILKLSNMRKINLKGIAYFKNIEKLYFRRVKITHGMELLKLPKLRYINLAESKYSKKLEKKLLTKIEIDKTLM